MRWIENSKLRRRRSHRARHSRLQLPAIDIDPSCTVPRKRDLEPLLPWTNVLDGLRLQRLHP
jgi:hypothetical protein